MIVAALIRTVVEYAHVFHSKGWYDFMIISIQLGVYFVYYTLMEYHWGFTFGKWLNKTRVITLDGNKPTFAQTIIRSIIRLIPIGLVMIITPYRAFLNDILSKTRTVRIKKRHVVKVNEI